MSFEIRRNGYAAAGSSKTKEKGGGPTLIQSNMVLENIEGFMHGQMMIDRESSVKGINMDYRPTSKYCHRVIITLLF